MTESTDRNEIIHFLIDKGCCKRCALRFIADYDNLEIGAETTPEQAKKPKLNPCIICLDLLHDATLESMMQSEELEKVKEYDCDTFINFISLPTSVLIREHSMEIYMKEKFPVFFKGQHIIPINKAWSFSIQNKLGETIGKKYDKNSYLHIQFNTHYEYEQEESSNMYLVENKLKKTKSLDNGLSRSALGEALKTIDSEVFKKYVTIPPEPPKATLTLEHVTCKHDYIYLAGRYCKYSRSLFQTPWVNEDNVAIKNSIQEILFNSLQNTLNCSSLVFSASGREDYDVRMLGRGRPFFIKVCDPKVTKVPYEKFRSIEREVRNSNLIKVLDLQFVHRSLVSNIKEGEQFKQKTYRALCMIDKPENLNDYIEKINNIKSVKLQQKTPLRVYHRRTSDVREREIYSIEARPITGINNLFEIDVVTQAGTYVKEFVHGDLGRTKPCLSQIVGGYVDIIALDVLDIHLDFPPHLTEEKK